MRMLPRAGKASASREATTRARCDSVQRVPYVSAQLSAIALKVFSTCSRSAYFSFFFECLGPDSNRHGLATEGF
jgi:hypothetical protein